MNNTPYSVKIDETKVDDKRLGRHILHDPRSRTYSASQAHAIRDVAHRVHGLPLNQARGSCTAEALCGAADADPDFVFGRLYNQADADFLYNQEIILEGGNPDTDDPGGTGLMVCKAAQKLGWIKRYEHAFGLTHALKALTIRPTLTGVDWYEGFDHPDSNGLVKIAGGIRGGHEFVALGIDTARRQIAGAQSWGEWGVANSALGMSTGVFFMTWDTWDELLHNYGDVTVPLMK